MSTCEVCFPYNSLIKCKHDAWNDSSQKAPDSPVELNIGFQLPSKGHIKCRVGITLQDGYVTNQLQNYIRMAQCSC